MQCDRCGCQAPEDEIRELHGQNLCEDCYMDTLSPTRTCDPWAVHSAKNAEQLSGGEAPLTDSQNRILELLQSNGPLEPNEVCRRLNLSQEELQRDVAALRHLEKLGGSLQDGRRVLRLW